MSSRPFPEALRLLCGEPLIDEFGAVPVQRGVWPHPVVLPHPSLDDAVRREAVRQVVQIDAFLLQGAPKPLNDHFVLPSFLPVHGDSRPSGLNGLHEGGAGVLDALIRVEDDRRSPGGAAPAHQSEVGRVPRGEARPSGRGASTKAHTVGADWSLAGDAAETVRWLTNCLGTANSASL